MKKRLSITIAAAAIAFMGIAVAANQDQTTKPAVQDAVVHFGALHPQPPAPHNHVLLPDEVTIFKGGMVTFIMNGGGHGIAIYPVSKNTTREHIAEDLCQGGPTVCNVPAMTAVSTTAAVSKPTTIIAITASEKPDSDSLGVIS